jgi:hypothetical protein
VHSLTGQHAIRRLAHRLYRPLASMRRLKDLPAVREKAREIREGIRDGMV